MASRPTTWSQFGFSPLDLNAKVEMCEPHGYTYDLLAEAHDVQTFAGAAEDIRRDRPSAALGRLDIFKRDWLTERPCFHARLLYLTGVSHMARALRGRIERSPVRYYKAELAFKEAREITNAWNDPLSQATLSCKVGDAKHERYLYHEAAGEYLTALELLENAPFSAVDLATAMAVVNTRLARQYFVVGNYPLSHKYLDAAEGLFAKYGGKIRSPKTRSDAGWMGLLLWRASSRLRGGDIDMLRTALRRAAKPVKYIEATLKSSGGNSYVALAYARLLIQVAETHTDLALTYRGADHNRPSYQANYAYHLKEAQALAVKANDLLRGYLTNMASKGGATRDEISPLLLKLVFLRHDYASLTASELAPVQTPPVPGHLQAHALLPKIIGIQKFAFETKVPLLLAQAATLHGEVALAQGKIAEGMTALYRAMSGFHQAYAPGESTRARFAILQALDLV